MLYVYIRFFASRWCFWTNKPRWDSEQTAQCMGRAHAKWSTTAEQWRTINNIPCWSMFHEFLALCVASKWRFWWLLCCCFLTVLTVGLNKNPQSFWPKDLMLLPNVGQRNGSKLGGGASEALPQKLFRGLAGGWVCYLRISMQVLMYICYIISSNSKQKTHKNT